MSDIYFDTGAEADIYGYRIKLQETITIILKKIGISDKGISWVIVEEEKFKEMDNKFKKMGRVSIIDELMPISPLVKEKYKYGRCNTKTNTIWISTAAIHKAPSIIDRYLSSKEDNLLVNVILDELAHIETGKKHGDREYERVYDSFYEKYYG